MDASDFAKELGPELAEALVKRGFTSLTSVQESILDPALQGRDLRISSQTGSGKTVAIGFALRAIASEPAADRPGRAAPRAMVIVPTRELAKQVDEELTWLFQPLGARVVCVTGGSHYREELRALAQHPTILIATPGRLLDHLRRQSVDPSQVLAVVLDEADRMLDLGFREDLEAILAMAPPEHRTHLVSATFPREVKALADRVQTDAISVEGTPLGTANADIDHILYLVQPRERLDAIVNLLLAQPGSQTLVFARTRADVAEITKRLGEAGFTVGSLSGEMEQGERNRAMAAFKRGGLDALVATDVAARGIDVQDIAHVIHVEPPTDADSYTHRSGRTGRAGKKGKSLVLVAPAALSRASMLLKRAGVKYRIEPIPSAEAIREARARRLYDELTREVEGESLDPAVRALAERIAGGESAVVALARLIARVHGDAGGEPRTLTPVSAPAPRPPFQERAQGPRPPHDASARSRGPASPRPIPGEGWVSFHVSWGQIQGADARRLLAMVCRRGGIRGSDVGSIRVTPSYSIVDVASGSAEAFERAVAVPDPRDARVVIRKWQERTPRRPEGNAPSEAPPARGPRPAPGRASGGAPPPKRPYPPAHPKAEKHRKVVQVAYTGKVPAARPSRPSADARKRPRPA